MPGQRTWFCVTNLNFSNTSETMSPFRFQAALAASKVSCLKWIQLKLCLFLHKIHLVVAAALQALNSWFGDLTPARPAEPRYKSKAHTVICGTSANLNLETKLKYQTGWSLTWLAKASLISNISMSFRVRPTVQKSQDLKGDIFALRLYRKK